MNMAKTFRQAIEYNRYVVSKLLDYKVNYKIKKV